MKALLFLLSPVMMLVGIIHTGTKIYAGDWLAAIGTLLLYFAAACVSILLSLAIHLAEDSIEEERKKNGNSRP